MLRDQPQSQRERALLSSRISQIIRRVNVVYHRIRILVPGNVDASYTHSPFVPLKLKSLFQPQIQAEVIRKTHPIWRSDQLLLIQYAEWESRVVLEKSAEQ